MLSTNCKTRHLNFRISFFEELAHLHEGKGCPGLSMSQSLACAAGLVEIRHRRVGVGHEVAQRCGRVRLPGRARGQQRHRAHCGQQCACLACRLQGAAAVTSRSLRALQSTIWSRQMMRSSFLTQVLLITLTGGLATDASQCSKPAQVWCSGKPITPPEPSGDTDSSAIQRRTWKNMFARPPDWRSYNAVGSDVHPGRQLFTTL